MEITVFFDKSMKNMQVLRPGNPFLAKDIKPKETASMIDRNYYAVSKNGGPLMLNPEHVDTRKESEKES